MRVGPERVIEKEFDLNDHCYESGLSGIVQDPDFPPEAYDFIRMQFDRFGVPLPDIIADVVLNIAIHIVAYVVDVFDPYALLIEVSDLEMTEDWRKFTYDIKPFGGKGVPRRAKPEQIETFRYNPKQCEEWYTKLMSHPGLENLPGSVGEILMDEIDRRMNDGEYPMDMIDEKKVGRQISEICGEHEKNYYQLAAWAAFVWLASPFGRKYRYTTNLLFESAIDTGEVLIHEDIGIVSADFLIKTARAPYSCVECGLDSYCVEMVFTGDGSHNMCEHCTHDGKTIFEGANCGTRWCKYISCQYHPDRLKGNALYETMRGRGLLGVIMEGQEIKRLA